MLEESVLSEEHTSQRVFTQLKYPILLASLSFEKHFEVLKSYVVKSKEGKEPVSYKDVGITVSPFKVSATNRFFEHIGFLSRTKGSPGKYVPTPEAISIHKDLLWGKEAEARKKLAEVINGSWFWHSARDLLEVKGKCSEDELVQHLGREAGADPRKHTYPLKILITYLRFAELLDEKEGFLVQGSSSSELGAQEGSARSLVQPSSNQVFGVRIDGKVPILFGVLVGPDTSEEQIRRAVRTVLDEIQRLVYETGP